MNFSSILSLLALVSTAFPADAAKIKTTDINTIEKNGKSSNLRAGRRKLTSYEESICSTYRGPDSNAYCWAVGQAGVPESCTPSGVDEYEKKVSSFASKECQWLADKGFNKKECLKGMYDSVDKYQEKCSQTHGPTPNFKKLSNTACGFGGYAEEGYEFDKWYGKSEGWCQNKCENNDENCRGYDYDKNKDRCRIFYEFPNSRKYKKGVTCYLEDTDPDYY